MKSLIFQPPMVRATLAGQKDVTRRLKTTLKPGDVFYVKEAFRLPAVFDGDPPRELDLCYDEWRMPICYQADGATNYHIDDEPFGRLRNALHMPEWASRIRCRVVSVRAERLMDITEEDAVREGIEPRAWGGAGAYKNYLIDSEAYAISPRGSFASLWNSIHGPGAFEKNPTVQRIEFERIEHA